MHSFAKTVTVFLKEAERSDSHLSEAPYGLRSTPEVQRREQGACHLLVFMQATHPK
jgi:hypothetical protein